MKKQFLLLFFIFGLNQVITAQHFLTKEEAITIFSEQRSDMEELLDSATAILNDENIWEVTLHYGNSSFYKHFINAETREISLLCEIGCEVFETSFWSHESNINFNVTMDTLHSPHPQLINIPQLEYPNMQFSPNSERILITSTSYVGIVKTDGTSFQKIVGIGRDPKWFDNEWISYSKNDYLYKRNIYTQQEEVIFNYKMYCGEYSISPDKKWIAFSLNSPPTTGEEYVTRNGERKKEKVTYDFGEGGDVDIYLCSTKKESNAKVITVHGYDYMPCWSENSDTLFFDNYFGKGVCYVSDFQKDTLVAQKPNGFTNLVLNDYQKVVKGFFPYVIFNQILMVERNSLKAKKLLLQKKAHYGNCAFSKDLNYLAYTKRNKETKQYQLWILPLNEK